jgi:two-component system copper resistance phosphate regulon response regulator CusR/two-component system response regulator QseB
MKILVVEDDRKIGQFVKKGLEEVSYTAVWVRSCEEANEAVAQSQFDVIILDIGLPDGSGLELLTEWRERKKLSTCIIILSARHEVDDKIVGLNLGADDYLTKPFSFGELLARLRSVVRRYGEQKRTVLEHRGIRLDLLKREVTSGGEPVQLSQKEFALLEFFLENPARVLTRTQIAERIWDCHFDMETNLVDVYVGKLRGKLRRANEAEPLFQSVRGVGYKFA